MASPSNPPVAPAVPLMTLPPEQPVQNRALLVAAAAIGGFVLYAATCAPGVLWQDSAMFQFRVWHMDVRGDLGLPLAHPLHILLARGFALLPLGEFAWRVNLFSSLCGAVALALAMNLLLTLTRRPAAAAAGTLALAVSHTFWTHSVIAEVYNLYAVGLLAELTLIHRLLRTGDWRWLAAALAVNGLSFSNHVLAILHAPAYAGAALWMFRARRLRWMHIAACTAAWLVGSFPYGILVAGNIAGGQPVGSALWEALAGPENRARLVTGTEFPFADMALKTAQYFALNFPTPLLLAAPLGLARLRRDSRSKGLALFALAVFAVGFAFAFRYRVSDQIVFFTPCYVIAALFIGVGTASLLDGRWPRTALVLACALLPIPVYEIAPAALERFDVSIGAKRDIPMRDTLAYFVRPRKNGDDSARRFAEQALAAAAPDCLLYADITIKNALVYVRDVEGLDRGVTLTLGPDTTPAEPAVEPTPDVVAAFASRGEAFACFDRVPYVPQWMAASYDFQPVGIIYRLVPRQSAP